jgi:uncharacterized membrane protein YkvA (DUF1232 family)
VSAWLQALAIGIALLVGTWLVLVVLARTLPPGPLRELVRILPDCAVALRALYRDPRVPRKARVAMGFALLWVLSPVDLIPEFLPVIGPLDDVVVVALALRYVVRVSPPDAVVDAWPGDPRILDRLAGRRAS